MVRDRDYGLGGGRHAFNFGKIDFAKRSYVITLKQTKVIVLLYERREPIGESVVGKTAMDGSFWERAWEAYQGQQKPGGDEKLASFRNRAKQENDARYLGDKYFKEVCQYLPKSECPPS